MTRPEESRSYLTDTTYVDRFFPELSPVWLNYVAALNGVATRDLEQPFTYLDLGCGYASSTVVNAAAFVRGEFFACDLLGEHIDAGRRHAAALGVANVHFYEATFDRLLTTDLPAFDFIVMHGVYSWIDESTRETVRRIIRQKLKPGGLVYVSYNCLPGWSVEAPLRKLLFELAVTEQGSSARRARFALHTLKTLSDGALRFFVSNPAAAASVRDFSRGRDNYLAHEFLNPTWAPSYSVDVADEMSRADVRYIGSATLVENHPVLNLDAQAAEALVSLATERQRHLATDFATNRRFRRDVFVRATQSPASTESRLSDVIIGCADLSLLRPKVRVPRGELEFQADFIAAVKQLMRLGSMRFGDAVDRVGHEHDKRTVARNLEFLVASGVLMPFARVHRLDDTAQPRRAVTPLVHRALSRAVDLGTPCVIPSAILGNGIEIGTDDAGRMLRWLACSPDVHDDSIAPLIARFNQAGIVL